MQRSKARRTRGLTQTHSLHTSAAVRRRRNLSAVKLISGFLLGPVQLFAGHRKAE